MTHQATNRDTCPCCLSQDISTISSIPFNSFQLRSYLSRFYDDFPSLFPAELNDLNFTLAECNNCSLIFQTSLPSPVIFEQLYSSWISESSSYNRFSNSRLQSFTRCSQELIQLSEYLKPSFPELITLDYGFGWAQWALCSHALGFQSYGYEFAQSRIRYAQAKSLKVIPSLSDYDSFFHIINLDQVLEHLADPVTVLSQVSKSLRPGGILKISVPGGRFSISSISKLRWDSDITHLHRILTPIEHLNVFNHQSMYTLARSVGLIPLKLPLSLQFSKMLIPSLRIRTLISSTVRPFLLNYSQYYNNFLFTKSL